jgi:hypothetical protein
MKTVEVRPCAPAIPNDNRPDLWFLMCLGVTLVNGLGEVNW